MRTDVRSAGAFALVAVGMAAAFALAACCALPFLLAGAGLSAYWLGPVASLGERFGNVLALFSLLALAGAVFVVARGPTTCSPAGLCARLWFRVSIVGLAATGMLLLLLSKLYA